MAFVECVRVDTLMAASGHGIARQALQAVAIVRGDLPYWDGTGWTYLIVKSTL